MAMVEQKNVPRLVSIGKEPDNNVNNTHWILLCTVLTNPVSRPFKYKFNKVQFSYGQSGTCVSHLVLILKLLADTSPFYYKNLCAPRYQYQLRFVKLAFTRSKGNFRCHLLCIIHVSARKLYVHEFNSACHKKRFFFNPNMDRIMLN